jgi:hypothetical protein
LKGKLAPVSAVPQGVVDNNWLFHSPLPSESLQDFLSNSECLMGLAFELVAIVYWFPLR